jgi:hypothetical protein
MTNADSRHATSANATRRQSLAEAMRGWNDILCLWRLCDQKACRRARACRGNVHVCVPRNFPLLPEGVRAWFAILAQAQEEQMSFDDAMASLDGTPADDAFWEWHETVETSQRPRQIPRDIAHEPQR